MMLAKNESSLKSSAFDHTKATGPQVEQLKASLQPDGPRVCLIEVRVNFSDTLIT